MLELLKTLGSFAGLATGAFVLFDRCMRGRPIISLKGDSTAHNFILLTITNPDDRYIAIREVVVTPKVFGVAMDTSVDAMFTMATSSTLRCQIAPHETKEFHFVILPRGGVDAEHPWVRVAVHWRKTSSLWLPQIPVFFWTSTREVRNLQDSKN
jgi:hypothetical protein